MTRWKIMFSIVMIFVFFAVAAGFGQVAEAPVEDSDGEDHAALIARLSEDFGVEPAALEALLALGHSPGEIWLALEIMAATDVSLDQAVLMAEDTEGHGWGELAQVLGLAPGSAEFMALKEELDRGKGAQLREQERNNEATGMGKPESRQGPKPGPGEGNRDGPGQGEGSGRGESGKPEKGSKKQ